MKTLFKPRNTILIVLFIISYLLYFIVFFQTLRYSRLNLAIYFGGFVFMLILILVFSVLLYEGIIEKKNNLQITGIVGMLVLSLLLGFSSFYLFRLNSSINNVIVDPTQSTSLELSFVTYDNATITEIGDLNNKKIGILSNSENMDRNSYIKTEIEKKSLNIEYIEYLSYNDALLGLFTNDIDVAVLPSDYYNQFSDYEGYEDYLEKTKAIYSFTTEIESTNIPSNIDVSKEPFSVLIMGNDGGRTDSLILATYNPIRLEVTMTSIPRDSYVPIACYPNQQKDKIGHAFSVSRDCAIETVENLFDIDISFYVVVNFKGVVEIVDALDGVWLESPVQFVGQNSSEERGHYTVWIPKGGFWATGEMALTFARERHQMPGGDYQRQENQQQVISSLIERVISLSDVNKALNVLDAAGENIETNMSLDEMIEVFNGISNAVTRTTITPEFILDIVGSRVMGYSSYTYNETLQLPLWISKPYQGSIDDLKKLMLSNLEEPSQLPTKIEPKFNAAAYFFQIDYFALVYYENEIHERLPDFMPNISYNDWTLEKLKSWASSRDITINVQEVRDGDALYNASYIHNYIVGQSVKYGIKTNNFNNLTVKVIKQELDCKQDLNKEYEECRYKLPNFVEDKTKVTEVESWAAQNNITLTRILIPETDVNFDKTKIGFVVKQFPESFADIRSLTELQITIMDANYSVTIPDTNTWKVDDAILWVKENMFQESNYQITYVPTLDLTKLNQVTSTKPLTGTKIKIKDILLINAYGEGFELGDYVGKTRSELEASVCSTLICKFSIAETSDQSLFGKVESQSIQKGTIYLKSVWASTEVTFRIYSAPTSTSP